MKYLRRIEKATSVKAVAIIREPTQTESGVADFIYLPVFSVFDYGTIRPPHPLDNSTICLMAGFNFELLRDSGVDSHYIGLVTDDGKLISAEDAVAEKVAPTKMRVKFVNRIMPEFKGGRWDYSMFAQPAADNYVQPIEFISRNELPKESSVWKRVAKGELTLGDLGLQADFEPGAPVPDELKPILDYSTKFEPEDRYLGPKQTQQLLGVSDLRFAGINEKTRRASDIMTDYAASRGFKRADGKVEYVVLMTPDGPVDELGDAVCTWHEDRLENPKISKQLIRNKVVELNPKWYAEIERAKDYAREAGIEDFRRIMDPNIKYTSPGPEFFQAINTLFQAGTNQWIGERVYNLYPSKAESLEDNLARAVGDFEKVK